MTILYDSLSSAERSETSVLAFGADPAGNTAANSSFANALAAANIIFVPSGTFLLTSGTLVLNSGQTLLGEGPRSVLLVQSGWHNLPLLEIRGPNCRIENLTIRESGALPWGAKTGHAFNAGISVSGRNAKISDVSVVGFTFPLIARGSAADFLVVENSNFSYGGAWVEFDSVQDASVLNCVAHDNGLDGFKLQNEYSRVCSGVLLDGCRAYFNGRRDLAGGGGENTNGNGFDLYHGGYRTIMQGCRSYANYGSSVNLKGGASDPLQGELLVSNCEFSRALTTSNGSAPHGVEIGTSYENGNNNIIFSSCNIVDNEGDGIAIYGGSYIQLIGCNIIDNGGMGLRLARCHDVAVSNCNVLKNRRYAIIIGLSNDGTYESKRITIDNCNLAGTYSPLSVGASGDPRSTATSLYAFTANSGTDVITSSGHPFVNGDLLSVITYSGTLPGGLFNSITYKAINVSGHTLQVASNFYTNAAIDITSSGSNVFYLTKDGNIGLRTYTDSADIDVTNTKLANFTTLDGTYLSYAARSRFIRSSIWGGNRVALYVLGGSIDIDRSNFENTNWIGGVSYGSVRFNAGSGSLTNCFFSQPTLETSSRISQIDAGALNIRLENNIRQNVQLDYTVTAGATFDPNWIQQEMAASVPVSGYHKTGAIVWNNVSISGGTQFWRCISGGTPGTWISIT